MNRLLLTLAVTAIAASAPLAAQADNRSPAFSATYADLADLGIDAPLALIGTVRRAQSLPPGLSIGVMPGRARQLVEVDVSRLIRGIDGLPPRLSYLADVAVDSRGRPAKLRGQSLLIFARPVPGRTDMIQLVAPDAQLAVDAAQLAQAEAILRESRLPDAPPRITGITGAFHVPGALPGESETQIFLATADRRPVSLSVLRRPGETPRWAVALGEIVDEAAAAPARDTLLWYRLACGLPPALPAAALGTLSAAAQAAARADYALVLEGLGRCARNRGGEAPRG